MALESCLGFPSDSRMRAGPASPFPSCLSRHEIGFENKDRNAPRKRAPQTGRPAECDPLASRNQQLVEAGQISRFSSEYLDALYNTTTEWFS